MINFEYLNNPFKNRRINTLDLPITKKMEPTLFFSKKSNYKLPDWRLIKLYLLKEGRIMKECVKKLIKETINIFKTESNLLFLNDPIIIIGDLHGQFYDLNKIFELGGSLNDKSYLFLGNYINRGYFSTEIWIYLFSLKV